ncbi:MAG: SH3 domain-containing protein [Ruminococcus sp.]|nr:SH3 domain-containing protein [Ruminococcus sp.]
MNFKSKSRVLVASVSMTLVLCTLMVMFCTLTLSAGAVSVNGLNTITALNLRSSATTSSDVLTVIPKDKEVILQENSTNGWAKVSYGTYTGYCSTAYLNALSGSGVTMKGVTTDEVNLRSGKGTSYSSLGYVPKNTTVSVSSNADEKWAQVTYSSKTGYISKDYLKITFAMSSSAPTTSTEGTNGNDNVDYSDLPKWYSGSLTDSILGGDNLPFKKLMLDTSELNLDISETYKLTAISAGDACVMENISFSSDNTTIATVDKYGLVVGKSAGKATVIATNLINSSSAKCIVNVSGNYAPTEPPTEKPTQPTQAPTIAPTQAPTSAPTTTQETLSISASSATVYVGNYYHIKATSNATVTWSTSDSSIATVSAGIVTTKKAGTVTITAKTSTKTASCKITVKTATSTVNISHATANVTAGKTFLAYSSTSSVTWSSSDTSVATVNNGYILGVSQGQAVITVSTTGGAKTMLVKVSAAAPIRFAYTSPNCAPKDGTVTLIAITDSTRSAVKFEVTVGSTTKTIEATSKTADGKNYIWKGTTSFSSAGTYNVRAYSKLGSNWSTCSDGSTTAFVTSTTDKTTTVCANRRASDEIINLIANYEGFISSIYADPLTGDPTVGYGRVVYSGQQFYNNLSKTEAYAYLVQTVNNDGYATKVNSFLVNNSVKFNQQQFDALVCFVYNTGTGVLSNDDELKSALLDCDSGSSTSKTIYYINGSNVRIRKGPGTSHDIIDELNYGTELTILEKTNSSWYYVQLIDGTKGYVASDYITSKVSSGSLDLNFVKKQNLINKFCQYHHANGCIYGLLYRRVDEMEVFFYNDYTRNQGVYHYDIKFTCANNPNFHT